MLSSTLPSIERNKRQARSIYIVIRLRITYHFIRPDETERERQE